MDAVNDFLDHCKLLLPAVLVAMLGSAIKYIRRHRSEPFRWGELLSGLAVAAFAGLVVRMICLGFGLNDWLSTAAVAMAGYGGGKTLDLLVEAISKRAVR